MMSVNYRHKKTKQEKLLTEARATCLHSLVCPSATMNAWSEITTEAILMHSIHSSQLRKGCFVPWFVEPNTYQ
jgi:hypothetical protein